MNSTYVKDLKGFLLNLSVNWPVLINRC